MEHKPGSEIEHWDTVENAVRSGILHPNCESDIRAASDGGRILRVPNSQKVINYDEPLTEVRSEIAYQWLMECFDCMQSDFLSVEQSRGGVLVFGHTTSGKSTACAELREVPWSFSLGTRKDYEQLLTMTYRDGMFAPGPMDIVGSGWAGNEDELLINLLVFIRAKLEEKYTMDVIHAILSSNGILPISNGGLVQVDISSRAYGLFHMDHDQPVIPLGNGPWHPSRHIYIHTDRSGDMLTEYSTAVVRAASCGEQRAMEQEADGPEQLTAGFNYRSDRLAPLLRYEEIHDLLQRFARSESYYNIVNDAPKNRKMGLDRVIADIQPEVPGTISMENFEDIVNKIRKFLPWIEPGAVLSHLRPLDIISAINRDPLVADLLEQEHFSMENRSTSLLSSIRMADRPFGVYLRERAHVLRFILQYPRIAEYALTS